MGIQPFFHRRTALLAGAVILILFAGGCGRPAVRHHCTGGKDHGEKGGSPHGLYDPGRGLCQRGKQRPSDPLPSGEGTRCDLFFGRRALQGPVRKLPHQRAGPRQGGGDPRRRESSRNSTSSAPRSMRLRNGRRRARPISGRNWSGPHGAFSAFPTSGEAPPSKPVSIAAV